MSCTDHGQEMLIKTFCCFVVREVEKKTVIGEQTEVGFLKRDDSRA